MWWWCCWYHQFECSWYYDELFRSYFTLVELTRGGCPVRRRGGPKLVFREDNIFICWLVLDVKEKINSLWINWMKILLKCKINCLLHVRFNCIIKRAKCWLIRVNWESSKCPPKNVENQPTLMIVFGRTEMWVLGPSIFDIIIVPAAAACVLPMEWRLNIMLWSWRLIILFQSPLCVMILTWCPSPWLNCNNLCGGSTTCLILYFYSIKS